MPKRVYVIGHKNPDTDSICSAIAYANLKSVLKGQEYVPARAGNINKETQFVLEHFKVPGPMLLDDVRNRVGELLNGDSISIRPTTTLREVGILTHDSEAKTLAVVDEHQTLVGMVTVGDIAEKYMSELNVEDLNKMHLTIENLLKTLNGELLVGHENNEELHGHIIMGIMNPETLAKDLTPGDVVILGDRENAQLEAIKGKAALIIITGNHQVSEAVKKAAIEVETSIISVPYDAFAVARLINLSAPVENIMKTENILTFNSNDLVEDIKKIMLETRFRNYPVVDDNNRYLGMISRYHLLAMMKKKLILVDHNEKSQSVTGIEGAEILEVIDHHRVGDVQTGEPIYFRNEPVGCTSTIVASMYIENDVPISKEMAGIMLGAILSDTVIFKSPTCTPRDVAMAKKLAEIAGVVPEELGQEMYKVACTLVGRALKDIIFEDFKEFAFGDVTMGIGQVSTMDIEEVKDIKAKLLTEMENIRMAKGYHNTLLMVTDILKEGTELLVVGDDNKGIEKAFEAKLADGSTYLDGVLSRKKQVVPPLSKAYSA